MDFRPLFFFAVLQFIAGCGFLETKPQRVNERTTPGNENELKAQTIGPKKTVTDISARSPDLTSIPIDQGPQGSDPGTLVLGKADYQQACFNCLAPASPTPAIPVSTASPSPTASPTNSPTNSLEPFPSQTILPYPSGAQVPKQDFLHTTARRTTQMFCTLENYLVSRAFGAEICAPERSVPDKATIKLVGYDKYQVGYGYVNVSGQKRLKTAFTKGEWLLNEYCAAKGDIKVDFNGLQESCNHSALGCTKPPTMDYPKSSLWVPYEESCVDENEMEVLLHGIYVTSDKDELVAKPRSTKPPLQIIYAIDPKDAEAYLWPYLFESWKRIHSGDVIKAKASATMQYDAIRSTHIDRIKWHEDQHAAIFNKGFQKLEILYNTAGEMLAPSKIRIAKNETSALKNAVDNYVAEYSKLIKDEEKKILDTYFGKDGLHADFHKIDLEDPQTSYTPPMTDCACSAHKSPQEMYCEKIANSPPPVNFQPK